LWYVRWLNGLAFLPLTRLKEGVDYLKLNIPLGAEDFLNYFDEFDETYVGGTLLRVNKQNVSSLTVRRFQQYFLRKLGMFTKQLYKIITVPIMLASHGTIDLVI